MNQNTVTGDYININLRQLGATSIKEFNSIMHIAEFDLGDGLIVSYVFNITRHNKYFLQRMQPYAMVHGKFASDQEIIDFIDRKSVVQGKSVDLGGRRIIKKNKRKDKIKLNRTKEKKKEQLVKT